jgi:methylmalonyl-CoA/ethylmalonyl-CoA epimerase
MNLRLHHVGMLVADISKESLVYQERFGYNVHSDIIHDPRQTAYIQFLRLPEDRVYLELVSPDRPESKFSNALKKGVGLHHLCYSTNALEHSCSELRGKGMTLIQAPVSALAFHGRRIVWLMGRDRILVELVERGHQEELPGELDPLLLV